MRRQNNETALNLTSLMDTLTNVVGILAFIIILMHLSLAEAGSRIEKLHAKVDDMDQDVGEMIKEDVVNLKRYLSDIRRAYGELNYPDKLGKLTVEDVRKLKEKLHQVANDPSLLPRKKDIKTLEEIQKIKDEIAKADALLAGIKAKEELAETNVVPFKKITLPERQPPPKNKTPIFFVCRFGHIYPFNAQLLSKRFQRAVMDGLGLRESEGTIKIPTNDFPKVVEHFKHNDVGDEYTMIEVENLPNVLLLRFEPRKRPQGENLDDIKRPGSVFQRIIQGTDPAKHYVRFLVWGDSFKVYLAARDIVTQRNFQAAWAPYSINEPFRELIGGSSDQPRLPSVD